MGEGIVEVVSGVCGDEEDRVMVFGELDGERVGGCSFVDVVFVVDEDLVEGVLIEEGLEGRFEGVVGGDEGGGYGGGGMKMEGEERFLGVGLGIRS